jgi:hypothetical protein
MLGLSDALDTLHRLGTQPAQFFPEIKTTDRRHRAAIFI